MPPTRLQEIRKELGISRSHVARELDISERTVYRLERGVSPVRRVYLTAFAELYGVDVSDLAREVAA